MGEALAALRAGQGLAAAVVGQSGSARTEMVDTVLFAAAAEGALVGRGGGSGLRAFGGVLDGLEAWVDRRPDLLDPLPPRCRAELVALWAGEPPSSRQRLFVAVQELLVAAGRTGGAVLAVEDAHLVDRPTLELVGLLARTAPRVGVVLVVSHRSGFDPPGRFRPLRRRRAPACPRCPRTSLPRWHVPRSCPGPSTGASSPSPPGWTRRPQPGVLRGRRGRRPARGAGRRLPLPRPGVVGRAAGRGRR